MPPHVHCSFEGDSDSYGLGVRVGAYLQWFTSVLAYNLSPDEAASMRGVNTCFQIAMLAGLISLTVQKLHQLYAIELFVLLLFCIGGFCSACTFPWRPRQRALLGRLSRLSPSNAGGLVRLSLGAGTCAYGVWFTFKGLDQTHHPPCSYSVFFFSKVDLYGRAKILLTVVFVPGLALTSALLFNSTFEAIRDCYDYVKNWTDVDEENSLAEADLQAPSKVTICLSLLGLALIVTATELTLFWNNVQSIYKCGSTGQMFPLIIGIAALLRLLWKTMQDHMKGNSLGS